MLPFSHSYFGTISIGHSESKGDVLQNSILIKKGQTIPCEVTETFYTASDGQTKIECTITESKAPETDPRFVKIVHQEDLELPSGRPQGQEIEITYSYDVNQIIHASFKDVESQSEKKIEISMSGKSDSSSDINKFLVE